MAYTENWNLPEMPTGAVDWPTVINALVAKLEAGRTIKLIAAVTLAKGDPVYINSSGKAAKADGNINRAIAVWQSTSTAADAEGYAQVDGTMTFGSWTAGQWIYCSAAGALTATANGPKIGIAKSSTVLCLLIHAGLPQEAHIADAVTAHAITDPADSPADADALREDLVNNVIPSVESALNALGTKINSVLTVMESLKLTATS
jgi:hypothetical protein